jgi:hypothetical protein
MSFHALMQMKLQREGGSMLLTKQTGRFLEEVALSCERNWRLCILQATILKLDWA